MTSTREIEALDACCVVPDDRVECAALDLEKMKGMFEKAFLQIDDPICESENETENAEYPNTLDASSSTLITSNILETFCEDEENEKSDDSKATKLCSGEISQKGDHVTFYLGQISDETIPLVKNGQPIGHVYYNIPSACSGSVDNKRQSAAVHPQRQTRKNVIHILQSLPNSLEPLNVNSDGGPVTGLPVDNQECMFLLELSKGCVEYEDSEDLQMEVRLPKDDGMMQNVTTQCSEMDLMENVESKEAKNKSEKKSKKAKKAKQTKKTKKAKKTGAKKGKK